MPRNCRPKSDDNLPKEQRIWTIDKSRSRCSGKFAISYDPDECGVTYHGEHNATPDGRGDLESRLLEFFQRSPGIPFEVEELALQFSSSESHIRRLVKRLWRQGHITTRTDSGKHDQAKIWKTYCPFVRKS